jgi:hypothetical protein
MCAEIERMNRLKEILIVDNASTYMPLLAWYETCPYRVLKIDQNIGHTAAWTLAVQREISTDLYVVSDPDLGLSGCPADTLGYLAAELLKQPARGKVGLSLEIADYTPDLPFYSVNARIEASYWRTLKDGVWLAPVDTTFAIYHKSIMNEYRICGVRTDRPYTARHLPWYVRDPDEEFAHYLANASDSSSFKVHLPKMKRAPERGP